jgi:succinoglycan biosynthesis protein ExoW
LGVDGEVVGSGVETVSVIIPFFQRKSGILTKCLNTVKMQVVPQGWRVEVLLIDDGSPIPAVEEARGIGFREPFRLKMIRTENGGVGAARNRGLAEVKKAGSLIAFLDSDDVWPADHLMRAIQAMDEGFDFYFTDNRREGHHESHCRSQYLPQTAALLAQSSQKSGFVEIPTDLMVGLSLQEFPCQASTVVYRRGIGSDLRFDVELRSSGEDVLFFTSLVASAKRVCLDLDGIVECGEGVNIYFANLTWNSERLLSIKVDAVLTHMRIAETIELSERNRRWNDRRIAECRKELAFHVLRNLAQHPCRALREYVRLVRLAPQAALRLPLDMLSVGLGRMFWRKAVGRDPRSLPPHPVTEDNR